MSRSRRARGPAALTALTALTLLAAAAGAQQPLTILELEGPPASRFGSCLAALGDLDGDGFGDLAVGAHEADDVLADCGTVDLISGRTGATLLHLAGPSTGSWFGKSLAGPGDCDGDGVPDLAVSAPRASWNGNNFAGVVTLFSGADGSVLQQWGGGSAGAWFAKHVHAMGDVDGDGRGDLLLSSDWEDGPVSNAGRVVVVSGASGAVLREWVGSNGESLGAVAVPAGDLDGDGAADVAVAVPKVGGVSGVTEVRVFSTLTGAVLRIWPGIKVTQAGLANNGSGPPMISPGDLDGDGLPELVVNDVSDPITTRARVLSGAGGELYALDEHAPSVQFAFAVGAPGDVDLDGVPDIALGSPLDASSNGRVALHSGATGALLAAIDGYPDIGRFGESLAFAGDVDGDGLPDLAAAAPGSGAFGGSVGRVRVLGILCAGSLAETGTGLAGSGGFVPDLSGVGCPLPGSAPSLTLTDARGGAPAWLLLAAAGGSTPFKGGTLLVDPAAFLIVPFALGGPAGVAGAGTALLSLPIPADPGLSGLDVHTQVVVADPGAPAGFALTAAVVLGVG